MGSIFVRSTLIWLAANLVAGAVVSLLATRVPLLELAIGGWVVEVVAYFVIIYVLWRIEERKNLEHLMESMRK